MDLDPGTFPERMMHVCISKGLYRQLKWQRTKKILALSLHAFLGSKFTTNASRCVAMEHEYGCYI